jgi:hypothetical protein
MRIPRCEHCRKYHAEWEFGVKHALTGSRILLLCIFLSVPLGVFMSMALIPGSVENERPIWARVFCGALGIAVFAVGVWVICITPRERREEAAQRIQLKAFLQQAFRGKKPRGLSKYTEYPPMKAMLAVVGNYEGERPAGCE